MDEKMVNIDFLLSIIIIVIIIMITLIILVILNKDREDLKIKCEFFTIFKFSVEGSKKKRTYKRKNSKINNKKNNNA